MTLQCSARRQPDGSWGCLACKRTWTDGDDWESFCEVRESDMQTAAAYIAQAVVGVDVGKPGGDMSALSWPANHPPSLMEFVQAAGYDHKLTTYQRQLIAMLDEQIGPQIGRAKRRRT